MKTGIVEIIVGAIGFIALVVFLTLFLRMGYYSLAVYVVIAGGIFGGMMIRSGIKRIKRQNEKI